MSVQKFIRFTNDASLEKTLRLLQGLSQILAAYTISSHNAATWLLCRRQFALGRRFVRFWRWLGCFEKAWEGMVGSEKKGEERGALERMLDVGKWGFMGLFLACESLGILDVMGVWPSEFARILLIEGNKFWFYSLIFSLALGIFQSYSLAKIKSRADQQTGSELKPKSKAEYDTARRIQGKQQSVKNKLLADACDLLVPGFVLGWLPVSSAFSAASGCVSSWISLRDIWDSTS